MRQIIGIRMKRVLWTVMFFGMAVLAFGAEKATVAVHVERPGTLAELVGDRGENLDSLVVSGNINADDMAAMVSLSSAEQRYALDLSGCHIEGDVIPNHAFENGMVRSIIFPEGLTALGNSALTFCMVERVHLPSTLHTIGMYAFDGAQALEEINIPEGVEEIPDQCFNMCYSLERLELPQSLARLGSGCLFHTHIKELRLPENVKYIGENAFDMACDLRRVYCCNPVPPETEGRLCNTNVSFTVYVPVGSGEAYRQHPEWGKYKVEELPGLSGVESVMPDACRAAVVVSEGEIVITGASEAALPYVVYNDKGMEVGKGRVCGQKRVKGLAPGVYVVKVAEASHKVHL